MTLFHDMMHKEIEVYVDDMITKSQGEDDHVVNLKKLFERLRKFQLKLNPTKCTFEATSEKLLRCGQQKKNRLIRTKYEQYRIYPFLEPKKKSRVLWEGSTT